MSDENKLKPLIQEYEAKMGVEVIVVLAKNASHYLTVPLIYAIFIALPVPLLLYHFTNLSFNWIITAQLIAFIISFLLINVTPLKRFFTPTYHINDRMKQRARDILWAYNAFTKHNHGALLFFIADFEQKGIVRADKFLSERVSEAFLQQLTDEYNAHNSLEKALELAAKTLIASAPVLNSVDNTQLSLP